MHLCLSPYAKSTLILWTAQVFPTRWFSNFCISISLQEFLYVTTFLMSSLLGNISMHDIWFRTTSHKLAQASHPFPWKKFSAMLCGGSPPDCLSIVSLTEVVCATKGEHTNSRRGLIMPLFFQNMCLRYHISPSRASISITTGSFWKHDSFLCDIWGRSVLDLRCGLEMCWVFGGECLLLDIPVACLHTPTCMPQGKQRMQWVTMVPCCRCGRNMNWTCLTRSARGLLTATKRCSTRGSTGPSVCNPILIFCWT